MRWWSRDNSALMQCKRAEQSNNRSASISLNRHTTQLTAGHPHFFFCSIRLMVSSMSRSDTAHSGSCSTFESKFSPQRLHLLLCRCVCCSLICDLFLCHCMCCQVSVHAVFGLCMGCSLHIQLLLYMRHLCLDSFDSTTCSSRLWAAAGVYSQQLDKCTY